MTAHFRMISIKIQILITGTDTFFKALIYRFFDQRVLIPGLGQFYSI